MALRFSNMERGMKVKALRTVYHRHESKEYQKGETFEASERTARTLVKLRKVEVVLGKTSEPEQSTEQDRPRRQYKRRDMQAESE